MILCFAVFNCTRNFHHRVSAKTDITDIQTHFMFKICCCSYSFALSPSNTAQTLHCQKEFCQVGDMRSQAENTSVPFTVSAAAPRLDGTC